MTIEVKAGYAYNSPGDSLLFCIKMSLIVNEYVKINEKFENDQDLKVKKLSENKTDMIKISKFEHYAKCGEIFFSNSGKMYFTCSFCDSNLQKAEYFKNHIFHHLNLEEIGDIFNHSPNHSEGEVFGADEYVETSYKIDDSKHKSLSVIKDSEFDTKNTSINNDYVANFRNSFDDTLYGFTTHKSKNKNRSFIRPVLAKSAKTADETSKPIETTDSNFHCGICNKIFKTKRGIVNHRARHESNVPSNNLMDSEHDVKDEAKKKAPVKTMENLRKCSYCGKEFKCRAQRIYHERTHTGEKPHLCKICGNTFRLNYQLDFHMRTHTGERPYSCPQCPAKFANRANRDVHVRAHLGIKRFSCEVCTKSFVRSMDKKIHMRIHTGEKPYQCEVCGSSFNAASELNKHMKRHTNARPHKCEICEKCFYSKKELKEHQAMHSDERPFQCTLCDARFPRKKALRCHVKIHSDVKEFVCNLCHKAFAQSAGLYSHMKTHGHKPGIKTKELECVSDESSTI